MENAAGSKGIGKGCSFAIFDLSDGFLWLAPTEANQACEVICSFNFDERGWVYYYPRACLISEKGISTSGQISFNSQNREY